MEVQKMIDEFNLANFNDDEFKNSALSGVLGSANRGKISLSDRDDLVSLPRSAA